MTVYIENTMALSKRQLNVNNEARKIEENSYTLIVSTKGVMLSRDVIDQIFGSIIDGDKAVIEALKEKYDVEEKNVSITDYVSDETFSDETLEKMMSDGLEWEDIQAFEYVHTKVYVAISDKT